MFEDVSSSSKLYYILDTLMKCNSSRTLQQCLQQGKQRRNGGCRACYYSHSIVDASEALIKTVDTKITSHI